MFAEPRELMNNAPSILQEDEKDVADGPLEVNAELELNNSYLKWVLRFENALKKL